MSFATTRATSLTAPVPLAIIALIFFLGIMIRRDVRWSVAALALFASVIAQNVYSALLESSYGELWSLVYLLPGAGESLAIILYVRKHPEVGAVL